MTPPKNGRETGGTTNLPSRALALCTSAFRTKTGGREGHFEKNFFLIVAISPKASDSQSDPSGLAVRADGLKHNKGARIFTDTGSNTCKVLKITF